MASSARREVSDREPESSTPGSDEHAEQKAAAPALAVDSTSRAYVRSSISLPREQTAPQRWRMGDTQRVYGSIIDRMREPRRALLRMRYGELAVQGDDDSMPPVVDAVEEGPMPPGAQPDRWRMGDTQRVYGSIIDRMREPRRALLRMRYGELAVQGDDDRMHPTEPVEDVPLLPAEAVEGVRTPPGDAVQEVPPGGSGAATKPSETRVGVRGDEAEWKCGYVTAAATPSRRVRELLSEDRHIIEEWHKALSERTRVYASLSSAQGVADGDPDLPCWTERLLEFCFAVLLGKQGTGVTSRTYSGQIVTVLPPGYYSGFIATLQTNLLAGSATAFCSSASRRGTWKGITDSYREFQGSADLMLRGGSRKLWQQTCVWLPVKSESDRWFLLAITNLPVLYSIVNQDGTMKADSRKARIHVMGEDCKIEDPVVVGIVANIWNWLTCLYMHEADCGYSLQESGSIRWTVQDSKLPAIWKARAGSDAFRNIFGVIQRRTKVVAWDSPNTCDQYGRGPNCILSMINLYKRYEAVSLVETTSDVQRMISFETAYTSVNVASLCADMSSALCQLTKVPAVTDGLNPENPSDIRAASRKISQVISFHNM